ncbi:LysE family translocator [Marimonas lutisalis]|uniref:LysE family translocator n=1 Tax=Marimonas lutisalis TaxID=2545756 RepID=UPI001F1E3B8C|nr:LysE family translocator [Marimonas lutisalis]
MVKQAMLETLLAMDPALIAAFTGAGILLNLTPGADVLFVSASGLSGGPRAGIAAAAGVTLGGIVHTMLAALGLAALIAASPVAFDVIRYCGAAYLLYLAVRTWRAPPGIGATQGSFSLYSALKRGFLTNILNPKVALFILALLPQFTDPSVGPIWHQIILLGLIFSLTGLVINGAYGATAGLLRRTMSRLSGALNKITALVFTGLAARLIWE